MVCYFYKQEMFFSLNRFIVGDRLPALKSAMNIATPIKVGPAREPLVNLWEDKIKKIQVALHAIMPNNVPAPK